jgi:L-lactate dehydrogenase complex protein LldG
VTAARERILGSIRAALGPRDPAAVAARLAHPPVHARVPVDGDPVAHFLAKLALPTLSASGERIAALAAAPAAVAAYLARNGLPPRVAVVPALAGLDWSGLGVHDTIDRNEPAAVSLATAAIAETGSLVFTSAPDAPTLFNYLPLHHLAIVAARDIVRHMEDAWALVRARGALPRNVNLVTGTSGTADIEALLVRGAHGPRFLHVIVVED